MNHTPSNTAMYYLARRSCGCAVSYIADDKSTADTRSQVARRTSEWHRAGYDVEHVTEDVVNRDYGKPCPHGNSLRLIFE